MPSSFANIDHVTTPSDDEGLDVAPQTGRLESRSLRLRDISMGSLALMDQVVVSGTNFLTFVLIANICTKTELGIFSLAWTIVGFLRTTQDRMLSAPYLVFSHRPTTDRQSWLGSSLVHEACLAAIGGGIAATAALFFAVRGRPVGLGSVMAIFVFSAPLILLRDHVRAICSAHFRYGISLLINVTIGTTQLVAIGILWYLEKTTIPLVVLCLGIACVVPLSTWLLRCPQPFHVLKSRIGVDWHTCWTYSKWLVAARVVGMGGFLLVPWIVVYFMDSDAAGDFAACSNLVGLSLMFINGMNNFFQPRTVRAFHDHGSGALVRTLLETIVVFLVSMGTISVAFFFAGNWLLTRIYGADFGQLGTVACYLSLSMLTVCVSIACGNGLAALGKPKGYFWGELSYCCVSLLVAFVLVPRFELRGAAWALISGGVAASIVTSLTLAHLVRHEHDGRTLPHATLPKCNGQPEDVPTVHSEKVEPQCP